VIRVLAPIFLLAAALHADPEQARIGGRVAEAQLLARWPDAGPAERWALHLELDRIERERGFVEARCVLVKLDDHYYALSELFDKILDPALETAPRTDVEHDLGLQEIHLQALAALTELRKVHAAPAPVNTPTLNLLLGYANRILGAWKLSPRVRLRLLMEVLRNVRELEGRADPDARTGWVVHEGIVPALLGLARRYEDDLATKEAISQAAALLTLPSVLDAAAVAQLAALTRGADARKVLMRAYRRGDLDDMGVTALARSVVAQGQDDPAFLAGAAPVLLELLGDGRVPASLRGQMVDLILRRFGTVEPLRPIAEDLLAASYGAPPQSLADWKGRREGSPGPLARPTQGEVFRFLQVVLLKPDKDAPPAPARVIRADVALNRPVRGGKGSFLGLLVPAVGGESADYLGPIPGLSGIADNRLVRRTLRLERISIRTFGARGEEIELCVALPRDGIEPVPVKGARLGHVLDLIRVRLDRSREPAEIRDLVDLLVRIGTPAARDMAVKFAGGGESAASLLELLEAGDTSAAHPLFARLQDLSDTQRERALVAILRRGGPALRKKTLTLAGEGAVDLAASAADALLQTGDAEGVLALLQHKDRYARLSGIALALRLTPNAGALRIEPNKPVDRAVLAQRVREAFPKEMGGCWKRLGGWLPTAFEAPTKVRTLRGHESLYAGRSKTVSPARFAEGWTAAVKDGKFRKRWPWVVEYVLTPRNPGRAIKPAALAGLLDALEVEATKDPLRRAWIDSLVILVAVQSGLEFDTNILRLAEERLRRIAGKSAPAMAKRRPGIAWPVWAARDQGPR